jgi:hypothetical protein
MKKYIFEGITNLQLKKLRKGGVCFSLLEKEHFFMLGKHNLTVDEKNFPLLLQSLGYYVVSMEEATAGIWKVKLDSVEDLDLSKFTVSFGNEPSNSWEFEDIIREIIIPVAKMDVVVNSFTHGTDSERFIRNMVLGEENVLNIILWGSKNNSSHDAGNGKISSKTAFGIKLNDSDWNWWDTSNEGIQIINPDNEKPIAEIIGNCVYVFAPIGAEGMRNGRNIFREIAKVVVMEIGLNPEERVEMLRNIATKNAEKKRLLFEEQKRNSRQNYIGICRGRRERVLKNIIENISSEEESIRDSQQEVIVNTRNLKQLEKELQILEMIIRDSEKKNGEIYDSLFNIPGIKAVSSERDFLKVVTENICATPDGQDDTCSFGEFEIRVYMDGENGGIQFFNLTQKGEGDDYNIHHPHVDNEGYPMPGNMGRVTAQLIGENKIDGIVLLALQFLRTIDMKDPNGKEVFKFWPKVSKKSP